MCVSLIWWRFVPAGGSKCSMLCFFWYIYGWCHGMYVGFSKRRYQSLGIQDSSIQSSQSFNYIPTDYIGHLPHNSYHQHAPIPNTTTTTPLLSPQRRPRAQILHRRPNSPNMSKLCRECAEVSSDHLIL